MQIGINYMDYKIIISRTFSVQLIWISIQSLVYCKILAAVKNDISGHGAKMEIQIQLWTIFYMNPNEMASNGQDNHINNIIYAFSCERFYARIWLHSMSTTTENGFKYWIFPIDRMKGEKREPEGESERKKWIIIYGPHIIKYNTVVLSLAQCLSAIFRWSFR